MENEATATVEFKNIVYELDVDAIETIEDIRKIFKHLKLTWIKPELEDGMEKYFKEAKEANE